MSEYTKALIFVRAVLDPSFRRIFILLLLAGVVLLGLLFWSNAEDEKRLVNSSGQMALSKDSSTGLSIYDTSINKGFASPSFVASVFNSDFLVRGVEVSAIDSNGKMYSDLLDQNCLKNALDNIQSSNVNLETSIVNSCGDKVYPNSYKLGKPDQTYSNPKEVIEQCSLDGQCGQCLLIQGSSELVGDCSSKLFTFKDRSLRVTNSGGERVDVNIKPVSKISYLVHQK